jgi:diguanylate cyclase (GGDEF)-like protein
VRALTSYHPLNVRDTARHIATVAARALSCEVAALQVCGAERPTLEVLRLASGNDVDSDPRHAGRDAGPFLEAAAKMTDPIVEQTVGEDPQVWLEQVVSRMTLPIGSAVGLGALALGHEAGHARGFTTLCQRIGRAIAESAEPLLSQAIAHERFEAEHELLRRAHETDPLTGIGNRSAWDSTIEALDTSTGERSYVVLSIDLDGLKFVNDEYGHAAGDTVLCAAANILRSTIRGGDVLARVGGDEFLVLLPNSGECEARRVIRRIYRAASSWRVTEFGLMAHLSVGWAVFDGDWTSTIGVADERMYAVKRQRRRKAPAPHPALRARAARTRRSDATLP